MRAEDRFDLMQIFKNWLRRNSTPYQETPFGLVFNYQGGNFIISDNTNDPDYFQLIMPGIMDVEGNLNKVLKAANNLNQEIKCVKCTVPSEKSVWLATEILLDKTPEIDSIMPRLIAMLHGARVTFNHHMR